jgi:hypothetical protein
MSKDEAWKYTVRQGDGMSSIAEATGFFWQTLWDLPENAELKARRPNPEVLLPGDIVTIPARRAGTRLCATGKVHRFRRRGVPVRVALRLVDSQGEAFAKARYRLQVGELEYQGETDDQGRIEQWVAPAARKGTLTLWPGREDLPQSLDWALSLGHMDPLDTVSGVQARLANLGYTCGAEDGGVGPETREALRRFQRKQGLEESGEIDEPIRARIGEVYGF